MTNKNLITLSLLPIILTIILLSGLSDTLFACSCIGERTVREEIKHSDAVLIGTIVNKEIITLSDSSLLELFPNDTALLNSSINRMSIARYDFLIQDIYKGRITKDTVTIYTGLSGGDCGVRFEVGKKYIVYGEEETYFGQINNDFPFPKAKNTYWTNICTRTTSFFQNEIDEIEIFCKKN